MPFEIENIFLLEIQQISMRKTANYEQNFFYVKLNPQPFL